MHKTLNKLRSAAISGMIAAASVAGSFSATTPSTVTAAGSNDYAKLLQYSLYFYDANMCGDEVGAHTGLSWRKNCHTSDEIPGGFHDAGDHAMFGLPQGYSASTLGWSYYEFKDAYTATGQGDHLKVITDHFCDFFKRSTKLSGGNVSNFLYQKGSGKADHQYWGAPENQTGNRKMYWSSNGASDIAAEYAAALAFNYINFGNREDLTYAEALYKFSTQYNQVAVDGPIEDGETFYKNSSCKDEQAWAAAALYLATNNQSYLNDAKSKVTQYLGWVHGWENVDLGAACLIAEATNDWSKVNNWIGQTTASRTQNGYYFLDKWGSARLNCSMQFTALVASKHSNKDFTSWAQGQMDYITGNNPSGYSFVIGIGSKYPQNPHHRGASGYNNYDEMGNSKQAKAGSPTLIGALVGGPSDGNGSYQDDISDYVCNEVAIDYNAGLVGAAAGLYSLKKTGTVASNIEGVTKIYNGNSTPTPTVTTTSGGNVVITPTTTTAAGNPYTPSTPGKYELKTNKNINYGTLPDNDKMIGFDWADFDIGYGEKATKVEVNISANGNIGKWQGAFGSSTSVAPDYWTQTGDMQETFSSNKGTITWNIPSSVAGDLAYYNGQLKFGVWWIDCQQFTIDSIVVYTDGTNTQTPVVTTTKATTTSTTTTTTTKVTTTAAATTTTPAATTTTGNNRLTVTKWGDANNDNELSIADATAIFQHLGNRDKYGLTEQGEVNADVFNPGDGISSKDANVIQQVDAGIYNEYQLPIRG